MAHEPVFAKERPYVFSALLSTYNSERFIRGRLDDLINQTLGRRLEIVIVNSGSQQNEDAIIQEFMGRHDNITYLHTREREPGVVAINRAIRMARGTYLAFANADDRYRADALATFARVLDARPEFGAAYADSAITLVENETFEHTTAATRFSWPDFTLRQLLRSDCFGPQYVWRASLHASIGDYDETYPAACDYEFVIRAAWRHGAVHVHDTLGLYLNNPQSSEHANLDKVRKETDRMLRGYRQSIPLHDIYPKLTEDPSPEARAAALMDFGNCCILSDSPDYDLALHWFGEAMALTGSTPQLAHNVAVARALLRGGAAANEAVRLVTHPVVEHACLGRGVLTNHEATVSDVSTHVDYPNPSYYFAPYASGASPRPVRSPRTAAEPLVSVIVPTFNRPDMLVRAVQSIVNQNYRNIEIIVVNDAGCPVDHLLSPLDPDGRISCIRFGRNRERSAVRNAGLRIAQGEYIAYLDDDDLFYPNHVGTLVSVLSKHGWAAAYSDAFAADQARQDGAYVTTSRRVAYSSEFNLQQMLVENMFPNLCVMHRKSCLDEVGYFDETLSTHEDWDLWIRIGAKFSFGHIPVVTAEYTIRHDGSNTTSTREEDFLKTRAIIYQRYRSLAAGKPETIAEQGRRVAAHSLWLRRTGKEVAGTVAAPVL